MSSRSKTYAVQVRIIALLHLYMVYQFGHTVQTCIVMSLCNYLYLHREDYKKWTVNHIKINMIDGRFHFIFFITKSEQLLHTSCLKTLSVDFTPELTMYLKPVRWNLINREKNFHLRRLFFFFFLQECSHTTV